LKGLETQREFGAIPNLLNESKFGIAFFGELASLKSLTG
jgi:hypothetical protein